MERSLLDEDKYLRFYEFDRVSALRGRPRGSTAFTPDPRTARSTAPFSTVSTPASNSGVYTGGDNGVNTVGDADINGQGFRSSPFHSP